MIAISDSLYYWNYYLAIEDDLVNLSRYIEFCESNFTTYSIELAHLLLSSASEVDVVMKQLCRMLSKDKRPRNINGYRNIIHAKCFDLIEEKVTIARYGMEFQPWINWRDDENPNWWRSYNNVKHNRDNFFNQASLQNVINSIGALYISVVYYYKLLLSRQNGRDIGFSDVTIELIPESKLIRFSNKKYYYEPLVARATN